MPIIQSVGTRNCGSALYSSNESGETPPVPLHLCLQHYDSREKLKDTQFRHIKRLMPLVGSYLVLCWYTKALSPEPYPLRLGKLPSFSLIEPGPVRAADYLANVMDEDEETGLVRRNSQRP